MVDGIYNLEKFSGKGGWTYARIPEVKQDKSMPFGWVKVRGKIDDYEFHQVKLMPMGDGKLFFPVKKLIRKKIGKEAGDSVHIILYNDDSPLLISEEIKLCFFDDSEDVWDKFLSLPEGQQKQYLDWITDAKKDKTKVQRILAVIEQVKARI